MPKRFPRLKKSQRDYIMANHPDKRIRLVYRIRHIVGILCALSTALFVILNLQLFTPESVKNIKASLHAASISSSDTSLISFPSGSPKAAVPFGSGLAVCDNGTLDIMLPGSYSQLTADMPYANPVMRTSDRYLLVFDRGAHRFTVTNTLTSLYSNSVSSPITDAQIAGNGNVAIVTNEAGYKSAVRVYNQDHEQVYLWKSPNYYIMSTALSSDGMRLAMFCFKQEGLNLVSKIFFTDINSTDLPTAVADMGGRLSLGLKFLGRNTVCAVTDNGAFIVTRSGDTRYALDYASSDLLYFDLLDDDCAAICTTSYSQEGRAEIQLLNARGLASRNPLVLSAIPDAVSFYDNRLAVLSGDRLTFYSRDLSQIDEQSGLSGASRIFMRPANTCLAVFSSNARVLVVGRHQEEHPQ